MSDTQAITLQRTHSTSNLAQLLFKAELPDEYVRSLPAQSLYLAVRHLGVSSCADILETASVEQCRLMLDFDCWQKDRFNEDNFFEWLAIADEEHGLKCLQKLVKALDLKVVSLLISRYVQAKVFDEKTDSPPGPDFFTPDLGFTWINVTIEEASRNFLFSRLLALIFETDADLFYQLLAIPGVATDSLLEDEAYVERNRRTSSEGIPDMELAYNINSPLSEAEVQKKVISKGKRPIVRDIPIVEPLVHDYSALQPLTDLVGQLKSREEFECELTLIMNAALVRWGIDFDNQGQIQHLITKVRGAINIGLEALAQTSKQEVGEIFESLGLQDIYRVGLTRLNELHKFANRTKKQDLTSRSSDPEFKILAGAMDAFPELPTFVSLNGKYLEEDGKLATGFRAFERIEEIKFVNELIKKEFSLD